MADIRRTPSTGKRDWISSSATALADNQDSFLEMLPSLMKDHQETDS
jgi:hypothetical protein